MPVTPVSVGPALRAWMDAGLTHLLLEGTVAEFEAAAVPEPRPAAVAGIPAHVPEAEASGMGSTSSVKAPQERKAAPTSPRASASSPLGGRTSAALPPSAAAPVSLAFASAHDIPVSPAEWPEPWRGWFAKTVSAPILWTYHELGADLTGVGRSPERSGFFKNLIAELALPKGSSVFWPSAMPVSTGETSLASHAPLFAAGLRLLMPRVVVVFGDAALDDIGLCGRLSQFGQVVVEGKLLVLLPGVDELLRGDAQRSSAVSLLRALFAAINFGN